MKALGAAQHGRQTDTNGYEMDSGLRTGLFFGLTSGVITTLGLIVGLHSGTQSVVVVLNGIVVIALADGMSDAVGVHIAQEAEPDATTSSVWRATFATLVTKFVMTLSFLIPVMLLPESTAIIVAILWGYAVLAALSYFIARSQSSSVVAVTAEHLTIATIVVLSAHWIGEWANQVFA